MSYMVVEKDCELGSGSLHPKVYEDKVDAEAWVTRLVKQYTHLDYDFFVVEVEE